MYEMIAALITTAPRRKIPAGSPGLEDRFYHAFAEPVSPTVLLKILGINSSEASEQRRKREKCRHCAGTNDEKAKASDL